MASDERVFTISNFLSVCRVVLLIPIFYFLSQRGPEANVKAVIVMLIAAATDYFDGFLARRLHKTSNIGRVLDPLADKVAIGALVIFLVLERGFPLWLVVFVLARDLVILVAGLYIARRYHYIVESNWYGKVAVTVLAMLIIVFTLEWQFWTQVLIWASVLMLIVSSVNYVQRFLSLRKTFAERGQVPAATQGVATDSS